MTTERIEYAIVCDVTGVDVPFHAVAELQFFRPGMDWEWITGQATADCQVVRPHKHQIVHRSVITTDWKPVKP